MINKVIAQYNQSIELRENAVNHINCNSIIGIRDIDEEHIHINNCMFYLLNTAKNTNMQCQQILEHMSNLKTKLIIHFENEELVLSKIDAYEHTKMQQIHYDVLDQFNKAYDAIIVSPISILEYIKNLLHEHINTCDIILKK
jgi:hemerythrin